MENYYNVLIISIVAIVVSILFFLLLREFWCWYFKFNKIVKLLEKIESNTSREVKIPIKTPGGKKEEVDLDKIDDKTQAIKDCTKAIKQNPMNAQAYYDRGMAKYALGDKKGAYEDLNEAGILGDKDSFETLKILKEKD